MKKKRTKSHKSEINAKFYILFGNHTIGRESIFKFI